MQYPVEMNNRSAHHLVLAAILILANLACDLSLPRGLGTATQPEAIQERLFRGITYERRVTQSPRPLVIHIVTVDMQADGIKPLVTPPANESAERAVPARTTSEFLQQYDLQLAVNGDYFSPWFDAGPLGYAPKAGDLADPQGFAASNGKIYSDYSSEEVPIHILRTNRVTIGDLTGRVYMSVSGNTYLVRSNTVFPQNDNNLQPRTAIGINQGGTKLTIIVVDGRQPGYSEGMTLTELAALFAELKVYTAVNMDGGGSSTLVVAGNDGTPRVLNSPVHGGIPGNERPVANHLGFYASGD